MIPSPEEAWELLCAYNQGEFHRRHGRIVGDVLRLSQTRGWSEKDVAICE